MNCCFTTTTHMPIALQSMGQEEDVKKSIRGSHKTGDVNINKQTQNNINNNNNSNNKENNFKQAKKTNKQIDKRINKQLSKERTTKTKKKQQKTG